MNKEQIQDEIIKIGLSLLQDVPSIDIYLFGSILINPLKSNDIDVLIVYNTYEEADIIRNSFSNMSLKWPLDLLFLTKAEVIESNFHQKCSSWLIYSH